MNQPFSLTRAFDTAEVPLPQRDLVTALSAARQVAYSLPLPTERVGSPIDTYNATYAAQAEEALGGLNEVAVMDFDFALAACRLYWLARYKVLHEPDSSEAMQAVTGLVEALLAKENVPDLGFTRDPHGSGGGLGSAVVVVDGRTTLACPFSSIVASSEAMAPAFRQLWDHTTQGG